MLLDAVLAHYIASLTTGFIALHAFSLPILGVVAGVAWVRGAMYSIGQAIGDVLANVVTMLITLVIYALILTNLHPWMTGAFGLATEFGARVGGLGAGAFFTPSTVFTEGHRALAPLLDFLDNMTGWQAIKNIGTIFNFSFAYLVAIAAFMGVTLNICLTILAFHFALMCSAVLICWAPLVGTAFLAEFAFGWLAATIVRMMIQVAVVGMSVPLFATLVIATTVGGDPLWWESLGLVLAALLFFVVSWLIPNEAARALVRGGMSLGLGGDSFLRGAGSAARGLTGWVAGGSQVVAGVTSWIRQTRTS